MPAIRSGCSPRRDATPTRALRSVAFCALIAFGCAELGCAESGQGGPASAAPAAGGATDPRPAPARIVSAGGPVTEVLYELGLGPSLVGVDTTSTFPPDAAALPKVGYLRRLSAEGVVSLAPTLFIATREAEPRSVLDQLRGAGVAVTLVDDALGLDAAYARVLAIGEAVARRERAAELVSEMKRAVAPVLAAVAKTSERPRVLFVYARGQGSAQVAGEDTGAGIMIELAGGRNAARGFNGFRPLTAEAVVQADPDYYLMPALGLQSINGVDGLCEMPGIAQTKAGQARRVIAIDDAKLLGFGPRVGLALAELAAKLHPELPELAAPAPVASPGPGPTTPASAPEVR